MRYVTHILARKGEKLISVNPETRVLDALEIMADKNIGSIIVLEDDRYLGLMTERDYARKVILEGKHSIDTTISDIMSTDLPHVVPSDKTEKCRELMSERNIRYLPVFEEETLCGIISINDILKETILEKQHTTDQLYDYIQS